MYLCFPMYCCHDELHFCVNTNAKKIKEITVTMVLPLPLPSAPVSLPFLDTRNVFASALSKFISLSSSDIRTSGFASVHAALIGLWRRQVLLGWVSVFILTPTPRQRL